MEERAACALLKARFEAAGYRIVENMWFEGAGVAFEIDGYDAAYKVGYEYVTEEAGDTWDVGDDVIAALGASQQYRVLILHESIEAAELAAKADAFLAALPPIATREPLTETLDEELDAIEEEVEPAKKKPTTKKPPAKKPAKKPPTKKPPAKKKRK